MARTNKDGLTGIIGKYALYTMDGRQYVRSRPIRAKRKRGQAMPKLNSVFGLVSRFGTRLVKDMSKSFLFKFGRSSYNSSRGWMRNEFAAYADAPEWQLLAKNNSTSQLNPEADLRDILDAGITLSDEGDGMIRVVIPAINPKRQVKAPARTKKVNMKLVATTSFFAEAGAGNMRTLSMEQFEFSYDNEPTQVKEIKLNTAIHGKTAGNIVIVVLALEFATVEDGKEVYITEQKWLPAAIVGMGRMKN